MKYKLYDGIYRRTSLNVLKKHPDIQAYLEATDNVLENVEEANYVKGRPMLFKIQQHLKEGEEYLPVFLVATHIFVIGYKGASILMIRIKNKLLLPKSIFRNILVYEINDNVINLKNTIAELKTGVSAYVYGHYKEVAVPSIGRVPYYVA